MEKNNLFIKGAIIGLLIQIMSIPLHIEGFKLVSKFKEKQQIISRICVEKQIVLPDNLRAQILNEWDCFDKFDESQKLDILQKIDELTNLSIDYSQQTGIKKLTIVENMIKISQYLEENYKLGKTLIQSLTLEKTQFLSQNNN